jgi:hypothetical protein
MLTIQNNYVKRFDELDELVDYCKEEHENVYYLPNDGDTFYFAEDNRIHSTGNTLPHEGCTFTEPGIKAVFTKMGVPGLFPCMMAPNEPDVATKYLNKLLYDSSIQRNLSNQQFIVDSRKPNNPIVGMVSKTYLRYSNHSFLEHFLSGSNNHDLDFTRAFVDNTKMTIKWSEKKFSGIKIDGRPDRVKLGLYSGNSMIGNATLYFLLSVLDALCTNGVMLPKSIGGSRIVHKGDRIWSGEVENMVNDTRKSYDRVLSQIQTTLNIPFNTDTARIMLENDAPIDIPRDSRVPHKYWTTKRNFANSGDSTKALEHSLNFVKAIPKTFGGVHTERIFNSPHRKGNTSMYHFIGAFTEYAQQQPVREQYRIEEEAGELVNWFDKNSSKFFN